MFNWLVTFFLGANSVSALVERVRDAIVKVTNDILSLFKGWVANAIHMMAGIAYFIMQLGRFAAAVYDWAGWLLTVALPRELSRVWTDAVTWADQRIIALGNLITKWVDDLWRYARTELGALRSWAAGWLNVLRDNLGALWARFVNVERRVVQLLTDPRAFADWAAGAIVGSVGRWLYDQAESIARMLLSRSVGLTSWAADQVERLIVELFL